MKLSPLLLENYCLIDLVLQSNKGFKKDVTTELRAEDLQSKVEIRHDPVKKLWNVILKVQFQSGVEVNSPYTVLAAMAGVFAVDQAYPAARQEALVSVNGPSVLFGLLRETVHTLTCKGPHGPLVFPLVSFLAENPAEKAKETTALGSGTAPLAEVLTPLTPSLNPVQ